ncbi:MAG: methylenetetrahydrofolate reductase [NAD(P)H] [bacterium]
MKVIEALQQGEPAISFEFFPPKTKAGEENLYLVLRELKKFQPDFVSVTCGALGSTHDKTFNWIKHIKGKAGFEPVAHLTCVNADQDDLLEKVVQLEALGVENILALRGDPPEGKKEFNVEEGCFQHARSLVSLIKGHSKNICVGVAGYPEGHIESVSLEQDIVFLKEKINAGADYIITQLFLDNRYFFDFQKRCQDAGITVPIIPGIMPVTSLKVIKKLTNMCGATIPEKLLKDLEKYNGEDEAIRTIGVEHAVSQCQELLEAGVPGLHFFVMNQSGPISRIIGRLR